MIYYYIIIIHCLWQIVQLRFHILAYYWDSVYWDSLYWDTTEILRFIRLHTVIPLRFMISYTDILRLWDIDYWDFEIHVIIMRFLWLSYVMIVIELCYHYVVIELWWYFEIHVILWDSWDLLLRFRDSRDNYEIVVIEYVMIVIELCYDYVVIELCCYFEILWYYEILIMPHWF